MNHFEIDRSVPLLVQCRITCLRVTLRELVTVCITFDDFVGQAAHQIVFSVACTVQILKYWQRSRQ